MLIILSTIAATIFISCGKDVIENRLPTETQEGKNTFGALVDGEPFLAEATLFGLVKPINISYFKDSINSYNAGFLAIGATDARFSSSPVAGRIVINKLNIFQPGEYPLVDDPDHSGGYQYDEIAYYNEKSQKTYLAQSGNLTVTKLDTINNIISGHFYFTAVDSQGVKVEIKKGRFDVKYTF